MNELSFDQVLKLDCESRYEIFLQMVSDDRDIWVLLNDSGEFLTIHSDEHDIEYLPVWPSLDFTKYYSARASETLIAKAIAVPEFFAKWVSGLEGDNLKVGVFPSADDTVWIMEPSELKSDLQDEFQNASF